MLQVMSHAFRPGDPVSPDGYRAWDGTAWAPLPAPRPDQAAVQVAPATATPAVAQTAPQDPVGVDAWSVPVQRQFTPDADLYAQRPVLPSGEGGANVPDTWAWILALGFTATAALSSVVMLVMGLGFLSVALIMASYIASVALFFMAIVKDPALVRASGRAEPGFAHLYWLIAIFAGAIITTVYLFQRASRLGRGKKIAVIGVIANFVVAPVLWGTVIAASTISAGVGVVGNLPETSISSSWSTNPQTPGADATDDTGPRLDPAFEDYVDRFGEDFGK